MKLVECEPACEDGVGAAELADPIASGCEILMRIIRSTIWGPGAPPR